MLTGVHACMSQSLVLLCAHTMYTYAGSESISMSAEERGRGVGGCRKSPPSTVQLDGLYILCM